MRKDVDHYFEGYEKRTVLKENGKEKTDFVYVGNYFRIDTDKAGLKRINAVVIAAPVIFIGLFIAAGVMHSLGNTYGWTGLVSMIMLIPAVYWVIGSVRFVTAGEYMESRKVYYGHGRILRSLGAVWVFSIIQLIAEIISVIVQHYKLTNIPLEIGFTAILAAECALVYFFRRFINRIEIDDVGKVPYRKSTLSGTSSE